MYMKINIIKNKPNNFCLCHIKIPFKKFIFIKSLFWSFKKVWCNISKYRYSDKTRTMIWNIFFHKESLYFKQISALKNLKRLNQYLTNHWNKSIFYGTCIKQPIKYIVLVWAMTSKPFYPPCSLPRIRLVSHSLNLAPSLGFDTHTDGWWRLPTEWSWRGNSHSPHVGIACWLSGNEAG